ncbi:hypothetical protein [Mycolicibacterium palauense]|uniref:hypothetical protein n=1 Tax=Mycolicibacterium palauense TaxID=2034511 RepID=UPI000BFF075D|nr:hypothetical protein [Mycolicibacterium palauense]
MANAAYITNSAAQQMLTALGAAIDAGSAAVIEIYSGAAPANADASQTGTLLASLTCQATAFSGLTDTGTGARATFASITADASADATGTAGYFRIKTQTGGSAVFQGTVGTSSADLIMNTTSITAGSTVSISSATIDLPEGP